MVHTKFKSNLSDSFRQSIERAAQEINAEQDAIEIPNSGGQMLIRKNSKGESEREDLKKKGKCFPIKYGGEEFLVCVR